MKTPRFAAATSPHEQQHLDSTMQPQAEILHHHTPNPLLLPSIHLQSSPVLSSDPEILVSVPKILDTLAPAFVQLTRRHHLGNAKLPTESETVLVELGVRNPGVTACWPVRVASRLETLKEDWSGCACA
ncbi:hypothetical protein M758_1G148400 [Ceratodon purpureus]|uniref:Uncharacterized protein n=1 Tax=Ceratodon purpureus TaxID=3225 RepID=A0A8T0J8Q0_CERPU|nr:hypothetical protein KC19_1G151300 [Ceratodon purpureus]KAG0630023.1 hypothetical protein M758_1G148400 [Ceratodon purpureus]